MKGRPVLKPSAPRPSRALREKVYQRDRGICQLCGEPVKAGQLFTLDHRKPSSHGGSTTYANCRLAHKSCNTARRAPHPVNGRYVK